MATFSSLSSELTKLFLYDVLTGISSSGATISALDYLRGLAPTNQPQNPNDWTGYLVPPSSYSYTFIATSTEAGYILLNGESHLFKTQQNDVWLTDPIPLVAGTLYSFRVFGKLSLVKPLQQ